MTRSGTSLLVPVVTVCVDDQSSEATWISAFNRFAEARRQAGVRAESIQRPVDDPNHMVIDLDFDTTGEAEKFLGFLKGQIWGIRENSPALAGTPETMILETVTI